MAYVLPTSMTQCLDSFEVELVSGAFQAVLQALDESTAGEFSPLDLRRTLARSIIEPALRGERDPDKLRKAALSRLRALTRAD